MLTIQANAHHHDWHMTTSKMMIMMMMERRGRRMTDEESIFNLYLSDETISYMFLLWLVFYFQMLTCPSVHQSDIFILKHIFVKCGWYAIFITILFFLDKQNFILAHHSFVSSHFALNCSFAFTQFGVFSLVVLLSRRLKVGFNLQAKRRWKTWRK